MRFGSKFDISVYDYDDNGEIEFLIGQYFSSNINEYRLYRITQDKKIEQLRVLELSILVAKTDIRAYLI